MSIQDPLSTAGSATITRSPRRIQILFGGHLLADSGDVLILRQAGEGPLYFLPRKDVEMAVLQENEQRSRTLVGEARSFTIMRDRQLIEDVARSYSRPEAPYAALAGRIAFQPQYVEIHETDIAGDVSEPESFASEDGSDVDSVVRHTDSGSGFSQEATWEPTVSEPAIPEQGKPFSGIGQI